MALTLSQPTYADFINGKFENTYTPTSSTCSPIIGWTQTGYYFNGTGASDPSSIDDINLQSTGVTGIQFCGVTDIISGLTQTLDDYFLAGATPTPSLKLPAAGSQTVMVNLRSINAPLTKSGTSNPVTGWTNIASQATAISQQMVVQESDIDPTDNKVHIRFIAAPVLQNPAHTAAQQPFAAFQINNITTGRTGTNPLFFYRNYGDQAGIPWQSLTSAGTNVGSASNYKYTDLQAYDIAPGNAFVRVGDTIELIVVASGCSPGGHEGHLYLDEVSTALPTGLWVSALGPKVSTPGSDITYTYSYINNSSVEADNVRVIANMPQQANGTAQNTTFVSVTTPTTGTTPACTGTSPVTCTIGTLQPGEAGTFQLTVNIPNGWSIGTGPVNNGNYPINATAVRPLLGPLVRTDLLNVSQISNLIVDLSTLPTTAIINQPYVGTYSCANVQTTTANGDAINAICEINNLPEGINQAGCTISPNNDPWEEPDIIPMGQKVTCTVSGTPSSTGVFEAIALTDADNNSNSTDNQANKLITVSEATNSVSIPATLNGAPALNPAVVCCGRPVLLGPLPTPDFGITTYEITARTGNVLCTIGYSGSQAYLKMNGSKGSCTVVATKNGTTSAPFTVLTP